MDQIDIFGETQAPMPEPEGYLARDASVPQAFKMRLFEPQMEGQLALEMRTAPQRAPVRGATTTKETSTGE